jgi:Ca2+-binding RTX toxin-like protein
VEVGTDLAIVLSRAPDGTPLDAADVHYAYIPNMVIRQIGVDASDASHNIVMSNGGQLWVGDRATDTVNDDSANVVALSQTTASAQIWGLGGGDTISTGFGDDRVYGNIGADVISGGAGNDSLYGGQDGDDLSGGAGDDNVAGDLGNDNIDGGAGNDILYGGAGNDVIETGQGDDTVFAGQGEDHLTVNDSATGDKLVYMDKGQDDVDITSTTGDHTIYLGENNDSAHLTANAGDIQVIGDGGNDTIVSENLGSDTLSGGEDDDLLAIGSNSIGAKTLLGGDGSDRIYINEEIGFGPFQPNTQVTVEGGGGDDTVDYDRGLFIADANNGGAGDDVITFDGPTNLHLRDLSIQNFEEINFSDIGGFDSLNGFGDSVTFADGNNTAGGVVVNAWDGDDFISAENESSASYNINGGQGEDELIGGGGNDTLDGGEDTVDDTLVGGDGADTYRIHHSDNGEFVDSVDLQADDSILFHDDEFDGIGAFNSPFKGGSIGAFDTWNGDTNLYILTGEDYTGVQDVFDNFFTDPIFDLIFPGDANISAVVDHPIFFTYFDQNTGNAEVYYVDWTESWDDGDENDGPDSAVHVATITSVDSGNEMNNLDASQFGFY